METLSSRFSVVAERLPDWLVNASYLTLSLCALGAFIVYGLLLAVYRIYFSPISHIPGPKIAAATAWYEFYYDVITGGTYIYEIEKMHKKYGPIVRVNPWEVTILDHDAYREIYVPAAVRQTSIYHRERNGMGFDESHFGTRSHDLHRRRRRPIEGFFSRAGTQRIQPIIHEETMALARSIARCKETGEVIQLDDTFAAYTRDIIAAVCYEDPEKLVEDPVKSAEWHNMTMNLVYQQPIAVHLPFLMKVVRILPDALLKLYPAGGTFARLRKSAIAHIETAKAQELDFEATEKNTRSSIFRHLLLDPELPESEKSTNRLAQEAMIVVGAGGSTPGTALTITTYHIISNPHVEKRLREELAPVTANFPDEIPQWTDLEKLPYLQACLKEGMRMGPGAMRRTPRCFPEDEVEYKGIVIPKNTPIGIAPYFMHNDPEVYPNPSEFRPERWLADDISLLKRNWVPFSRGARGCAGINLAMAELSLGLATLFRKNAPQLRLYDTERKDIQPVYDRIIGVPAPDARGLRVTAH